MRSSENRKTPFAVLALNRPFDFRSHFRKNITGLFWLKYRGHSQMLVLALPVSVIRNQETWHTSLAVTISQLNQLLIPLVHRVGCTLEIMWLGNIQSGLNIYCASMGFEPDTFGVESNRFTNSATPSLHYSCRTFFHPFWRVNYPFRFTHFGSSFKIVIPADG